MTVRSAVVAAVVIAAALATGPSAHADTPVGCDTAGLVSAILTANGSGGGTLDLSPGCTYTLTSGPYQAGAGPDGLPPITTSITVHGHGATVTRDPLAPTFRLVEVEAGSFTADHLTLSRADSGFGDGGAILNRQGAKVTLAESILAANNASNATGGAISSFGTARLINSALTGNASGTSGGGIFNGGVLTLTNSTVSGNTAGTGGGAFNASTGKLTLISATVAGNSIAGGSRSGGGIANVSGGAVRLTNSILDKNHGGNCVGPAVADGGYNLDSGTSCGLGAATDKSGVDPQLGPIQGNGGPTPTMALASTSPAIDAIPAGANGCGTTITTDQRGAPRPQGAGCDIGAYEFGDVGMQSLTASPNPVPRRSKLIYTATVDNVGAADATGVTVTDTLPVGEKLTSTTATQGTCSVSAQTVTCNLGQVPTVATATVTIVVKVQAATGSTLTDTATVSATTGDTIPGNDAKTVSVTVS